MPMFQSDEEFEAYVAQQQAELAEEEPQPAAETPKPKSGVGQTVSLVAPLVLVVAGLAFFFTQKHDPKQATDTWDKILGTTAWATGREYNADANTLTERLTFRKKGDQSSDR